MRRRLAGLVSLLVLGSASVGAQELVTNGSFETGDFFGWAQSGCTIYDGVDNFNPHTGAYGAFFGAINAPCTISQSVATVSGAQYTFSFWLGNQVAGANSVAVSWGGSSVFSVANVAVQPYTQQSFTVTATSSSTLISFALSHESNYLDLDDISVRSVRTVPEPGSLGLIAAGMIAMVVFARPRRRP